MRAWRRGSPAAGLTFSRVSDPTSGDEYDQVAINETPVPPIRTCLGCRTRAPKAELLRVVARDGCGCPDPGAVLPGRGAYVHLDEACLMQASRRRAWARALRVPGLVDVSAVTEFLLQVGGSNEWEKDSRR